MQLLIIVSAPMAVWTAIYLIITYKQKQYARKHFATGKRTR